MTTFFDLSISGLRSNQHFLVWECHRRGISVEIIHKNYEVLRCRYGERMEYFLDIDSSIMPFASSAISGNKALTKIILAQAGIQVIPGKEFLLNQPDEVLEYANLIGFPIVLKPALGTNGDFVMLGIDCQDKLEEAIAHVVSRCLSPSYLIEKQIDGHDLKVFVTKEGKFAALTRIPPTVTGDGIKTVQELIDIENQKRLSEPGIRRLAPIPIDFETERFINDQGVQVGAVLESERCLQVRQNANVGTGAISVDCTSLISREVRELCFRVLNQFPSLPYCSVDLILNDTRTTRLVDVFVCEVNPLPSLGIHMAPARGYGQNVAAMIIDLVFPDSPRLENYEILLNAD
jgi:cyanophycin synthetase